MVPRTVLVVLLSLFLVAHLQTASLAADPAKEQAAVAVVQSWLALVDQGKYEDSWKEAASFFKKALTTDAWKQAVDTAKNRFGQLGSRSVTSANYVTQLPGAPDGQYVVVQFKSSFEKKKEAVETITAMMDTDGKWRVAGYYIQ